MSEFAANTYLQNMAETREQWARVLARPANYKKQPAKKQGLMARMLSAIGY